jgi:formate-dependent nitrite reductase membrane component NrfD
MIQSIKARMIVVHDFRNTFHTQREWSWLIALAFFLGELGAGLFLVSLWLDFFWGAVVGWLVIVVGKSAAHLIYLGRFERFWRMILNPGTSWIARGLIAIAAFVIVGGIYWLVLPGWIPLGIGSTGFWVIKVLAALLAFFILAYDGFVMNSSPAIPFWNTTLLPVLCVTYGLLGGSTFALLMLSYGLGQTAVGMGVLEQVEVGLIVANLLIVPIYLLSVQYGSQAARESVYLLVRRQYAPYFWGLVLFVGLIVTLILVVYFTLAPLLGILIGAAIAEIIGDYFIRFVLLRGGVYSLPVTLPSFAR